MDTTAARRPRMRDLGIVVGNLPPGPLNAITDVTGVRVGHMTVIEGAGPLVPGQGPVRTGVTVVLPHEGHPVLEKVPAAVYVINGAGEVTGRSVIEEWGLLESPIALTSTLNVGLVYDAVIEWVARHTGALGPDDWCIPVVAETYDGFLNDAQGRHVRQLHVLAALEGARGGAVPEGSVGGGTGMTCYGFKGGIGTARSPVDALPAAQLPHGLAVRARRAHRRASRPQLRLVPPLPSQL
jgi:D-aminopeptidase